MSIPLPRPCAGIRLIPLAAGTGLLSGTPLYGQENSATCTILPQRYLFINKIFSGKFIFPVTAHSVTKVPTCSYPVKLRRIFFCAAPQTQAQRWLRQGNLTLQMEIQVRYLAKCNTVSTPATYAQKPQKARERTSRRRGYKSDYSLSSRILLYLSLL